MLALGGHDIPECALHFGKKKKSCYESNSDVRKQVPVKLWRWLAVPPGRWVKNAGAEKLSEIPRCQKHFG